MRLITIPEFGTQEPQKDFKGRWQSCTPQTVVNYSAVGYLFGRQLHQILGMPVGLINASWGGSTCEAWIRREVLASHGRYAALLAAWEELEKNAPRSPGEYQSKLAYWKLAAEKAKAEGTEPPRPPMHPQGMMSGNSRPGNIYNGMIKPVLGYGIRGVIWYQGESNASRAYQYRDLFPLLIKSWRDEWGLGDFSFYWVQLADVRPETPEPRESKWAELREAQTMTLSRLPRTGQAVIIDVGEARTTHPINKLDVANRLARLALAHDYGFKIAAQSPAFKTMEKHGSKVVLYFDHVGNGLQTADVRQVRGFAIAGMDRRFVWANAQITAPETIEVWSDHVAEPVAVRYAWADNPVCNVYSPDRLPLTPFRTDDWPGLTIHNVRYASLPAQHIRAQRKRGP